MLTKSEKGWLSRPMAAPIAAANYTFLLGIGNSLSVTPGSHSTEDSEVLQPDDFEWVRPEQEVKRLLADLFGEIPEVRSICVKFGPEEITVWTLLAGYDRSAREKVYERELKICKELRIYDFDFRATSIDLVSPDELIDGGSREIFKRP